MSRNACEKTQRLKQICLMNLIGGIGRRNNNDQKKSGKKLRRRKTKDLSSKSNV